MFRAHPNHFVAFGAVIASVVLSGGCASQHLEDFEAESITVRETAPLAGAGLSQRKVEMKRAASDLVAFHLTLASMIERGDSQSVTTFSRFLVSYMKNHLDPLLQPSWQSRHAETISLDANLRLLEADVLVQLRKLPHVQRRLADISERYRGRGSLLVDYPLGDQSTLSDAVALLQSRIGSCREQKGKWGPGARARQDWTDESVGSVCVGVL